MKNRIIYTGIIFILLIILITGCGTGVSITASKNPNDNTKIAKILVMPLFEKLEYLKPFEESVDAYFNSKGLKSIGSLQLLDPTVKHPISEIKQKCDSLGIDAILVFTYEGTDKTETYTPGTTYVTGGYGGYWGGGYWGGGYYGGYGTSVTTTEGYWSTSATINITANVYTRVSKDPQWTAEIKVTDPVHIDEASYRVAAEIYSRWKNNGMLKVQGK